MRCCEPRVECFTQEQRGVCAGRGGMLCVCVCVYVEVVRTKFRVCVWQRSTHRWVPHTLRTTRPTVAHVHPTFLPEHHPHWVYHVCCACATRPQCMCWVCAQCRVHLKLSAKSEHQHTHTHTKPHPSAPIPRPGPHNLVPPRNLTAPRRATARLVQ